ncbi:hypothetical protein CEXT_130581 [Caerostris extrusa]|uniref:Ribosomal protein L5 n=1 Tax=Caerostris extrusa TaxID=172846 RepID=A0AAV4WYI3_CAEEX|nr:hypothetical protein CEXT_130581 [Caerostris extrusa]
MPRHQSKRENGANGEVFVENPIGLYRKAYVQMYFIVRQMFNKVKSTSSHPLSLTCVETWRGTQEDGLVRCQNVNAFNCCRFFYHSYQILHPLHEDLGEMGIVGTIALETGTFSIPVQIVSITDQASHIRFTTPFSDFEISLSASTLSICEERYRVSKRGGKLFNFNDQNTVMLVFPYLPELNEKLLPDLLVTPKFKDTPGRNPKRMVRGLGKGALTICKRGVFDIQH